MNRSGMFLCQEGMTLIELLITVLIIGILAGVAVPSYTSHLRQTRRADAKTGLMQAAQFLERNYSANNCYNKTSPADCSGQSGSDVTLPLTQAPAPPSTATYTLSATTLARNSYVLQATPTGVQTGDACGNFTLASSGVQGV